MVLHIKRRIDEEWQQRQSGDRSRREQALWAGLDKQLSNLEVDDVGVLPRVKQKYKKDKADREEKTDKPESTIKKDKKKEDTSRNDDKMPMYRPLHIENNDDGEDDEEMPHYQPLRIEDYEKEMIMNKKDKADKEEKTDKPESTIKKDKKKEDTSRNDDKMPMYRPLHIENNDDDDDDEEMPRYPQLWRD